MNRKIKFSSLIILLSILFCACSEDKISIDETNNKDFELKERLTLNKSTSKVSSLFHNMGVTNINVTDNSEYTMYELASEKSFILNGESISLSDYPIILQNEMIFINSNSDIKLTLLDGQPYIVSENYTGFIDGRADFDSIDFNILLLFLQEIITSNDNKFDTQKALNNPQVSKGCSFWNTYYVYSMAGSRSVAEANLTQEIDEYTNGFNTLDLSDCAAFGGVDTSCLWDNHACVSSQAFCCN